ncbi:MAG TPA: polysaccharide deacetylase family protein [Puia sp.]
MYLGNDLGNLWGSNLRFFKEARGVRILVYHGICEKDPLRYNNSFVTRKVFERHLRYYKKYFNVLTLDDYYNNRFSKDRFNVCITFDDGYANNYKYAFPLLKKYNLPAAFFITGILDAGRDILWNDFLAIVSKHGPRRLDLDGARYRKNKYAHYVSETDGRRLSEILREGGFENKAAMMTSLAGLFTFRDTTDEDDFWRQMTGRQLTEMAASPLVTIGCHGYYHTDLARIKPAEANTEIRRCRSWLRQVTGQRINAIAFPYGSYTRELVPITKDAGFDQLLPLDFYFSEDREDHTMRERFVVNPYISTVNQMIATIKRTYAF